MLQTRLILVSLTIVLLNLFLAACTPAMQNNQLRQAGQEAVYAERWIYYDTADFELQMPTSWRMEYVEPYNNDGTQLVVYGSLPEGDIDENVRLAIFKEDIPLIQSLRKYAELSTFNVQNSVGVIGEVQSDTVILPIGRTLRLRFRYRSFDAFGNARVDAVVQYLLIRDGKGFSLSMSAPAARWAYYLPTFEAIAETWRFHDSFTTSPPGN